MPGISLAAFSGTHSLISMVGVAAMATAFLAEARVLSRALYRRHATAGLFAGDESAPVREEG